MRIIKDNKGAVVTLLLILAFCGLKAIDYYGAFNTKTYKKFGIKVPKKYTIHGIDVSRYQGNIDWLKVSNMEDDGIKLKFAFIKATEGKHLVDNCFAKNWRRAQKTSIVLGAYHFFRPKVDAKAQAKLFIKTVKLKKGDLPPVLDIEVLNGVTKTELQKNVKIWCDEVEKAYGIKPIIYSSKKFISDYLNGIDNNHIWVAHYYVSNIKFEKDWKFWQHSDKGSVSGINHPVDFNVFCCGEPEFKQLLIP